MLSCNQNKHMAGLRVRPVPASANLQGSTGCNLKHQLHERQRPLYLRQYAKSSNTIFGLYLGYIGITEKKMETTILYWGYMGGIRG